MKKKTTTQNTLLILKQHRQESQVGDNLEEFFLQNIRANVENKQNKWVHLGFTENSVIGQNNGGKWEKMMATRLKEPFCW